MKTCNNCKHSKLDRAGALICKSPRNMEIDRVTGGAKPRWEYCDTHRNGEGWLMAMAIGVCGERGRWFEAKEAA
ncbi:hypothetical protein FHX57_006774 [Paraburkholderia tropica]|uniref:hypothetical protein n=1 Tax=Paraburkholderia tropica TaxID=92647 RepID=UPI00161ECD70|nr:hypothetical protein [Paraburkholderia tropica]MBB3004392.1 hypothetical protein [Paraburkholderia tropica]